MIIRQVYGDTYADWYDFARLMQADGGTYAQIIERFTALGIKVSIKTLCNWLKAREHESSDDPAESAA